MANAIYPKFKEQLLQGGVNMNTADIRFILFDVTDDAYDAANEFVSDLVAGAIVKRTAASATRSPPKRGRALSRPWLVPVFPSP